MFVFRFTQVLLAALFALQAADAQIANKWIFNYANKGYDFDQAIPPPGWQGVNHCADPTNQSPINLMKPLGVYGWAYGQPIPHEVEALESRYLNPSSSSKIQYKNLNYELLLTEPDPAYGPNASSYLKTQLVKKLYGSNLTHFEPNSFHLHHPSEFPVNGKHNDMSIHLIHYPASQPEGQKDEFVSLGLAIHFSVDNYDRRISEEEKAEIKEFFDTLDFRNRSSSSFYGFETQIPFGKFMDQIALGEKWQLDGSGALPPCMKRLAWQIVHQVYPIELQHKLIVQKTQEQNFNDLKSLENIRGIFPVKGQQVAFIGGFRTLFSRVILLTCVIIYNA